MGAPEASFACGFVDVYCALYQFEWAGIAQVVHHKTFGCRAQTPFFRMFAAPGPTDKQVLSLVLADMHTGESPLQPLDVAQCTWVLRALYHIHRDHNADLYCGDLVLHQGALYDWSTQRLTLERIRRNSHPPKKRFFNKYCVDIRHGIQRLNVRLPVHKTLLWQLLQDRLRLSPLPGTLRLMSHLLRQFNRLVNLLDGDLLVDATVHRFGEHGAPDPNAQDLTEAARQVLQWPRLRVFVQDGDKGWLEDSVAFSIMDEVASPEEAGVCIRRHVKGHRLELNGKSTALVPVDRSTIRQRENGRRGSLVSGPGAACLHNMTVREAYLYEVHRWVLLQPFLAPRVGDQHVLVVMPVRCEIKYPRPVLPYNSVVLTHRPIVWTGRGWKNGHESLLPGIRWEGPADTGYMHLQVSGQRLRFLNYVYLMESNSFVFRPLRRVGSGVCY